MLTGLSATVHTRGGATVGGWFVSLLVGINSFLRRSEISARVLDVVLIFVGIYVTFSDVMLQSCLMAKRHFSNDTNIFVTSMGFSIFKFYIDSRLFLKSWFNVQVLFRCFSLMPLQMCFMWDTSVLSK